MGGGGGGGMFGEEVFHTISQKHYPITVGIVSHNFSKTLPDYSGNCSQKHLYNPITVGIVVLSPNGMIPSDR